MNPIKRHQIPLHLIESTKNFLKDYQVTPFKSLSPLRSPWLQTIVPSLLPHRINDNTSLEKILLEDGDQLIIAKNTPSAWTPEKRTVVLVHGLTGCYRSKYLIRMTRELNKLGIQTIRMNLRGAGPGFNTARGIYHSGRSEDTRTVIDWVNEKYPSSPITFIGFSLGGNIGLKMAGEDRSHTKLDSIASVSAPLDLMASSKRMSHPRNRFFDQYFVKRLKKDIRTKHEIFSDLPDFDLPKKLSLAEFDHQYTAPRAGFSSGQEYYERCSSLPLLKYISIPTLLLCANDDPIVEPASYFGLGDLDHLQVLMTEGGGHMGFFSQQRLFWMDQVLVQWVRGLSLS